VKEQKTKLEDSFKLEDWNWEKGVKSKRLISDMNYLSVCPWV